MGTPKNAPDRQITPSIMKSKIIPQYGRKIIEEAFGIITTHSLKFN
jgi:hypothetical protein